jgi:ribosomal protein S15P/S13E
MRVLFTSSTTCIMLSCVSTREFVDFFSIFFLSVCFFFLTGLSSEIPEDLYCLIKKAVSVRKHLERNRKDCDAKFRLILIESRVHRCSFFFTY